MLPILKIDHVGIRVSDRDVAVPFYVALGFALVDDFGFDKGHPIILEHPSGVVLNLLGPADPDARGNVLMDVEERRPGYTHMALRVASLDAVRAHCETHGIAITGGFEFGSLKAVFVRDPDRNVIEFDEYAGNEPSTRSKEAE